MSKFLTKDQLGQIISSFKQEESGYLTTTQVSNLFSSSISRINRLALGALKNSPVLASEERIGQNGKYRLFLIEDVIEYYLENKYLFSPKRVNDREFQTVYVENNINENKEKELENLNEIKLNKELEELREFKKNQENQNINSENINNIKNNLQDNLEKKVDDKKNSEKKEGNYLDEYIQDLKNQIKKNDEKLNNKEDEVRLLNNESKNILSNLHNLQSQHLLLKRDVKLLFDGKIKLEDFSSSLKEDDKDLVKSINEDKLEDILIVDGNQKDKDELEELREFKKNQENKLNKKGFWNKIFG